ncbi:MAG: class I SAM-dependent methyltransferase [Planctomycetes bacterium]|nr:class I SAM-dependent methyltransferase [Planctomycetota bacterium]
MNIKSTIQNPNYQIAGDTDMVAGRAGTQIQWYEFAATFCHGQDVLDVGCGQGKGIPFLSNHANSVRGIDMDKRLESELIEKKDIANIDSKSVDTIVCIDVLEHVEDDTAFIANLARVAREKILLSTPNYAASFCRWPYHVREYLPHELYNLFSSFGEIDVYKGSQLGDIRYEVQYVNTYFLLNKLRCNSITGFTTRVYNKILPRSYRIQSHTFIYVKLYK